MTTSGTIGQTSIKVATLIEHSFRRAGVSPAEATIDSLDAAKNSLYFYLSSLSNDGVNLWTIENDLIGLRKNKVNYQIGVGTVDIKSILRRSVNLPSGGEATSSAGGNADYAFDQDLSTACTQTSTNGYISYEFSSARTVDTVGIFSNGDNYYELVWEYSNDGSTWTELLANDLQEYIDQEPYYYQVPVPVAALHYRVRETSGGTLDARQVIFAVTTTEIPLGRINIDQYTSLTTKNYSSNTALEFWFDRKAQNPEIKIWPVANSDFNILSVWRTRQIQDVGTLANTIEVPQRWIEALVTGLAIRMLFEIPGADLSRYDTLKKEADAATFRAQQEERDNSPITLAPNISCYTR